MTKHIIRYKDCPEKLHEKLLLLMVKQDLIMLFKQYIRGFKKV